MKNSVAAASVCARYTEYQLFLLATSIINQWPSFNLRSTRRWVVYVPTLRPRRRKSPPSRPARRAKPRARPSVTHRAPPYKTQNCLIYYLNTGSSAKAAVRHVQRNLYSDASGCLVLFSKLHFLPYFLCASCVDFLRVQSIFETVEHCEKEISCLKQFMASATIALLCSVYCNYICSHSYKHFNSFMFDFRKRLYLLYLQVDLIRYCYRDAPFIHLPK